MTEKYQGGERLALVLPGTTLGYETLGENEYGLVIGDPDDAAHLITGDLMHLMDFADNIRDLVSAERRIRKDRKTNHARTDLEHRTV